MTEGISSGQQNGNFPVNEGPYNSTPHGKKRFNLLRKIPNQHETKIEFDKLYNQPKSDLEAIKQKNKLEILLQKYQKSNATNENKYKLEEKYIKYGKLKEPNKNLFRKFLGLNLAWYKPLFTPGKI